MPTVGVWLQVVILATSAIMYFALSVLLSRRSASPAMRPGFDAFRMWWGSMGIGIGALACFVAFASSDRSPLAVEMAFLETFVIANSIAAAALLGHVVFVWTGSERLMRTMYIVLVVSAFSYTTLLFALDVEAVRFEGDDLVMDTGVTLAPGVLTWMTTLFFLPHVVGALCHLGFMLRAPDRGSRDRAALLGASNIMAGFSPGLIMLADEIGRPDAALLTYIVVLLAPVVAFLAYVPPPWVERRWALES